MTNPKTGRPRACRPLARRPTALPERVFRATRRAGHRSHTVTAPQGGDPLRRTVKGPRGRCLAVRTPESFLME